MARTLDSGVDLIGPIGSRTFTLEKVCQMNRGHSHNYDHSTIVVKGAIKVLYLEPDGRLIETEVFYPGQWVFIAKDRVHEIKAMADDTEYQCVFSHRDFDGLVTQDYAGNAAAYI